MRIEIYGDSQKFITFYVGESNAHHTIKVQKELMTPIKQIENYLEQNYSLEQVLTLQKEEEIQRIRDEAQNQIAAVKANTQAQVAQLKAESEARIEEVEAKNAEIIGQNKENS